MTHPDTGTRQPPNVPFTRYPNYPSHHQAQSNTTQNMTQPPVSSQGDIAQPPAEGNREEKEKVDQYGGWDYDENEPPPPLPPRIARRRHMRSVDYQVSHDATWR